MRYRIITIMAVLAAWLAPAATAQTADLFPLPKIPDEDMTLRERCNYMVYNFWKECPIKQSFSSLSRLDDAFGQWAGLMPYASADTVRLSIDNYLAAVNKAAPKNLPEVGAMAERWFYCDTAQYFSEEAYLPFCQAMTKSKKVPSALKARYQAQLRRIEGSGVNHTAHAFDFTRPDGTTGNFGDVLASRVILYFSDPTCLDCSLAKARLSADYNLNALIDQGLVKVVCIYPGDPDDEWKAEAARYPDTWVVGAAPDIDLTYDIPSMPTFYYLDGRHKVMGKNIDVDNLLYMVHQIKASVSPNTTAE